MRNLKLIAAVLFVAILLVGVFYLLRPLSVQNDTSLSMNDQKVENKTTFNQRATQTKVDTPPKALKQRIVAKPLLSVDGKKMNPLTSTNKSKFAQPTSASSERTLPPSKAKLERDKTLNQNLQIKEPLIKGSKKNAIREYRKNKLKSNN